MAVDVRVPPLGESISEGVIVRWLKQHGDPVQVDDPLLELETEKATMEIVAEAAGRLEVLMAEGATVTVGSVVARLADAGAAVADAPARTTERGGETPPPTAPAAREPAPSGAAGPRPDGRRDAAERPPLSPAVRKLVAEHDLDASAVRATGKGGRLTKGDVLESIEAPPATEPAEITAGPRPAPPEDTERVPMTSIRRRIAERLVEARQTAAILTTFNEVDLSELLVLRKRHRERFRAKHGVDLGLMSLFARACVLALGEAPIVNARIDGTDIVYHRHVHFGIAVSTPRGLVVPVVRGAESLSLAELERAIAERARLAREGRLGPDQLTGGTFTITNGGVFGSLLSTPLLNPPQSAILGMHKIEERPVAAGGQVVIRPMMYVALSYDHRLIDGEQAVTFLVRVKEQLEDPARMLLEV
jgi:2-oxoglutarate dehydrogenase E2 component (dihydrolipoamide succinyltransferase)